MNVWVFALLMYGLLGIMEAIIVSKRLPAMLETPTKEMTKSWSYLVVIANQAPNPQRFLFAVRLGLYIYSGLTWPQFFLSNMRWALRGFKEPLDSTPSNTNPQDLN